MSQSSAIWSQSYSRELMMDHPEEIDWITGDSCLENIKEPHFVDYGDPGQVNLGDSLGNNFYDCADLDDNIHSYLIKGLLGESVEGGGGSSGSILGDSHIREGSSHLNGMYAANGLRDQDTGGGVGSLGAPVNIDLEVLGGDLGDLEGSKVFESMDCSYVSHPHSHPLAELSEEVSRDQNVCYGMMPSVASSNLGISSSHGVLMGQSSAGISLADPPLPPSSSSSASLAKGSGPSPVSLTPQAVAPVNISQSLMTATPATTATSSSSASPVSYSPSSAGQSGSSAKLVGFDVSYQIESTQKRIRIEPEERIRIGILDDGVVESELKLGDHQIVDLDSSKGRRWSNNSTTSTISSNFSLNTNERGGCAGRAGEGGSEKLGMLGHEYQQDKFCSSEDLGRSQKPKLLDHTYEMGVIEDEHYQMGGQMEGEFFMNSDNYLTDEEKLKLRRRGRRRRPGEIEAWKTIIPRTTVDEAEHFVQTSQYRMRHVYRDPRAVSFVYRCVQHVDCQYEMRIYLISHETCYVQHRGYHTEEKQKYKRPGLPQHTLPLIDELIRKGLPPKSVIDHAIQIYPEVADQSNISVLYRQITNRQQYIRKRQRNYI